MSKAAPPWSEQAEEQLLGAAMVSAAAAEVVATEVVVSDFYKPSHKALAAAIVALVSEGHPVNTSTVALELERRGRRSGKETDAQLVTLVSKVGGTGAASRFAAEIVECADRRALVALAESLGREAPDRSVDVQTITGRAREVLGSLEAPLVGGQADPDAADFLLGDDRHNWVIPGLLEEGDRVILTGEEGFGKSLMLRQLAVCAAAGLHPFGHFPVNPVRTLIVDLENSAANVRRWLRRLVLAAASQHKPLAPGMLRVAVRTDGADLLMRSDVRWLHERMEANNPSLVVIGPLYKLHAGNPNDEEPAAAVRKVLDTVRARYGVTLVLEAHAPHGPAGVQRDMRPYGASLWKRWPEFGFGIVPDQHDPQHLALLRSWRGPREERDWPKRLTRGGSWPWGRAPDA